ncbi:MAG: hypothetical protein AB7E04_07105 [Desulfobacteraceae bacterium]
MEKNKTTNFDSPWKDIIEAFFPQFMEFFVPQSLKDIDFTKEVKFLDKELEKLILDSETTKRYADKLVEVTLNDESKKWILIHIEIQSQKDKDLSKRMFVYNYRIFDKYDIPVTSIAILADENKNWNPKAFKYGMWGSNMGLDYLKSKLLDYKDKWSYLETIKNPFAMVVMAHLKALETKKDSSLRKQWKLELTKLLYEKGYSRKEVFNLFRFIDWILMLPQKLNKIYYEEVKDLGGNKKMPYITDLEKYAMEKGFMSGEIKKSQNVLIKLMNKKFKLTKKEEEIISNEFNPQILDKALDEFVFADSKDAVLNFFK